MLGLQRNGRRKFTSRGGVNSLGELPSDKIGQAGVPDFACVHSIVQKAERLLDRGEGVPGVHLVEIDVVDPESIR